MGLFGEQPSGLQPLTDPTRAAGVGVQFDGQHRSAPAHFFHAVGANGGEAGVQAVAHAGSVFDHALIHQHPKRGTGDRAGERVSAKCRPVLARMKDVHHLRVREHGGDWIEAAGERLADQSEVGLDSLMLLGVLYDDPDGAVRLAPVYDVVTTTAYVPADGMALPLDGSTRWPEARRLRQFGETRGIGSPSAVRATLERVADALSETLVEMTAYVRERPQFAEIGGRMRAAWAEGAATSLRTQ